jgi:hypothetical protein
MRLPLFPVRRLAVAGVAVGLLALQAHAVRAGVAPYDWPQFGGDPQHSGDNGHESVLSASNVASLTRTFQVTLPSVADGAPVVLTGVVTASGTRDLLFLTTKDGHVLALDAHSGAVVWSQQYGPGSCKINNGSSVCFTTSQPAVDPGRAYVYAYGLDGQVHKYAVGSGSEVTSGGWPELATTKAFDEKSSSDLAVATASNGTSYLYVSNGGNLGDNGDYQGHVTAVNLSTGSQNVFNALCSNQTAHFLETPGSPDCSVTRSAVWARAGVVYNAENDTILFATGNGNFSPTAFQWGDSVLSLHPNATSAGGTPLDSYTPADFSQLESGDTDLGSTAPAILHVPTSSNVPHLAVQGGKDALLRLVNLDNLSGQGGPGHSGGEVGTVISVPQGGGVFTQPAVWTNPADGSAWTFVANGSGIAGLQLAIDGSGNPSLVAKWQSSNGGTSPVIANGVLYYASSGVIRGLSPTTGTVLWQNTQIGNIHWESPVVANGTVYVMDESATLSAFGGVAAPTVPGVPAAVVLLLAIALLAAGASVARGRGASAMSGIRAAIVPACSRAPGQAHSALTTGT